MLHVVDKPGCVVREDGIAYLKRHAWPGNVRELRNVLRRASSLASGQPIDAELLSGVLIPAALAPAASDVTITSMPIAEAREAHRKEYLKKLLQEHGDDHATIARIMGVNIKYARRLMRRYGFVRQPSP
jgi:DNA-binding NtrC family response regulator